MAEGARVKTPAEWTDRVRLDQIGQGLKRHLIADDAARGGIARTLDLADLSRLEADVDLAPSGGGWRLKGRVQADLVQTCGITLEPLPSSIDSTFQIDLREATDLEGGQAAFDIDPDGPDGPDLIEGGGIDLATYVVEHLALAIDPWPRKPGAAFEAPEGSPEPSPFDVLRSLKTNE